MSIHVALNHVTHYRYDRLINLEYTSHQVTSCTTLSHPNFYRIR